MTFQDALYQQLQQQSPKCDWHGQLMNRIEFADVGQADETVALTEQVVRAKLGIGPNDDVDWSDASKLGKGAIDWAGLLAFLEQVVPIIESLISQLSA